MHNLLWGDIKVGDTFIVKEDPKDCLDDILEKEYKVTAIYNNNGKVTVRVTFNDGSCESWEGPSNSEYYADELVS